MCQVPVVSEVMQVEKGEKAHRLFEKAVQQWYHHPDSSGMLPDLPTDFLDSIHYRIVRCLQMHMQFFWTTDSITSVM